jgi:hypothetical protein
MEGVDDWDKASSFGTGAYPRRSTSSLGDLLALTHLMLSETMLAWYEATGIGKREMKIKAFI